MPRHILTIGVILNIFVLTNSACRTYGEEKKIEIPQPELPLVSQPPAVDDENAPVLQKVVGELTRDHPANRVEVCTLIRSDFQDIQVVKTAIASLKEQKLEEGFILTPVVPSIQYFAFLGAEKILVSEIGYRRMSRVPVSEQGNPALETLMKYFDERCGVKDARP